MMKDKAGTTSVERADEPTLLFHGGKLFQQHFVDGFSKMEGARLKLPVLAWHHSFMDWQMCIGNGVNFAGVVSETTEIPSDMISRTEDELIDFVFPDPKNPGTDCAILAPKNTDCDEVNEKLLGRIDGEVVELLSVDTLMDAVEQEGVAHRPSTTLPLIIL
jgi:hypothetical protein